jgi:hypothetical protein
MVVYSFETLTNFLILKPKLLVFSSFLAVHKKMARSVGGGQNAPRD